MNYLSYFEKHNLTPREPQIEVLKTIEKNKDKKFFVVSAQTGVGKSHIALSLASSYNRSYIVTSTKLLQNQYRSIDKNCALMKGKGNYKCSINHELTCQSAVCNLLPSLKSKCISSNTCEYYRRLSIAKKSNIFLTNYSYFLFANHCGPLCNEPPRDIVIFDECHEIESQILSFAEETFNPVVIGNHFEIENLDKLKFSNNQEKNLNRLEIFATLLENKIETIENAKNRIIGKYAYDKESFNPDSVPSTTLKQLSTLTEKTSELDKYLQKIKIYLSSIASGYSEDWHVHVDEKENSIIISPLTCKYHFDLYLNKTARKMVFMSATPGSLDYISNELGIPKEQICYIEVQSDFDPEHSPVVSMPVGKMNYASIDATLPNMVKAIDSILENHKTDKGMIHTSNYKIVDYIKLKSKLKKRLICRNATLKNNEDLIKEHTKRKDPTVLISPSMVSGVDLTDELSRFQIICKLPFLSLANTRIAHKSKINSQWYDEQMLLSVTQMCGRSTRSKDDFAITYVLDSSFGYYLNRHKKLLPKWFLDRVHSVDK